MISLLVWPFHSPLDLLLHWCGKQPDVIQHIESASGWNPSERQRRSGVLNLMVLASLYRLDLGKAHATLVEFTKHNHGIFPATWS